MATSPGAAVFQRVFWGAVSCLLLFIFTSMRLKKRTINWSLKQVSKACLLGIVAIGAPMSLLFIALLQVPSSVASLINGLMPSFVLLLIILRKWPIRKRVAAFSVILSVAGVALITGKIDSFSSFKLDGNFFFGIILLLAMNFSYAVGNAFYDKLKPSIPFLQSLWIQLSSASLFVFLCFPGDVINTPLFHEHTGIAIILGLVNTTIAFIIYWHIVDKYGGIIAAQAPIIAPVFAVILSIVIGETKLSFSYIFGTVVVLCGVKLAQLARKNRSA